MLYGHTTCTTYVVQRVALYRTIFGHVEQHSSFHLCVTILENTAHDGIGVGRDADIISHHEVWCVACVHQNPPASTNSTRHLHKHSQLHHIIIIYYYYSTVLFLLLTTTYYYYYYDCTTFYSTTCSYYIQYCTRATLFFVFSIFLCGALLHAMGVFK